MEKTCGEATLKIVGGSAPGQTQLQLVAGDGGTTPIGKPREMHPYTAVGLGCAIAPADGMPYFVVQYGELPFGCNSCEWFYLYDARGRQLTRSDPPFLADPALPEGEHPTANTREYEQMIEALGLTHPEVDYIQ